MASLEEVLKGSETKPEPKKKEPVASAEAEPAEVRRDDKPRDDKGRFAGEKKEPEPDKKAEEKEAAPPAAEPKKDEPRAKPQEPQESDSERGLKAALTEERRKRQEFERKLREFESRQQSQKPPDVLENPEGFRSHIQQDNARAQWDTILNTSEIAARDKYGDSVVDEAQQWFRDAAEKNPAMWPLLESQRHPYKWVVDQHKREKFMQEVGDPETYRTNLEKQLREKLEAEFKAKFPAPQQPAAPPPSLASATSTGRTTDPVYAGPPSLESLLRSPRRA